MTSEVMAVMKLRDETSVSRFRPPLLTLLRLATNLWPGGTLDRSRVCGGSRGRSLLGLRITRCGDFTHKHPKPSGAHAAGPRPVG